MTNYCKCGCKTEIADDKTWVRGHHMRNRKVSDETKEKIRQTKLGHITSDETKEKMGKSRLGKTHSDETKEKMRQVKLGKIVSDETKEKIRQTVLDNLKNPDFKERHHMWYNHNDPNDGVVMLSPYSHRIGHAFLKACGVKIPHINIMVDD